MPVVEKFGRNVRAARHAAGLSQEELAHRSGLHRTYIGGIERGERNPSLENIVALAVGLGCSAPDLLTGLTDGEAGERILEAIYRTGLLPVSWTPS